MTGRIRKYQKAGLSLLLIFASIFLFCFSSFAETGTNNGAENNDLSVTSPSDSDGAPFAVDCRSALLIEANTGEILFSRNPDEPLPPASVTKVMTLLLVMEAIEGGKLSLTDRICVSAKAASMGGSQVFLEEGETFPLSDLLKCCIIASANDAAFALAEAVSGSEEAFVSEMNRKAEEMGLTGCRFENVTGLDDTVTTHTMSASGIAAISRKLIAYPTVTDYASLWQDTIRNGAFTLTNTNRLVRFYDGCNGLKTGSTEKAGYCISAAAKRGQMQLIAVVMGAKTRDDRNAIAKEMLDYGFSHASVFHSPETALESVPVYRGTQDSVKIYGGTFSAVVPKGREKDVLARYDIPAYVSAPLAENQTVGSILYTLDGQEIGKADIFVKEKIEKITYPRLLLRYLLSVIGR